MNRKGSIDTYGCANGVVAVNKARTDKPDLLIYYINSNAYSTIPGVEGYGWIETDQIDWYNRQAQAFRQANGDNPVPALSFFHIPLPEHAEALGPDKTKYRGTRIEKECAPQLNSGMFLNMLRQGGMMGAFVGHDHSNDYVALLHGIALGYGRFSGSTNTYQDLISGARVIEVDSARPGEFLTWMRLADGSRKLPVRVSEGKVKALELMD